MLGVAALLSFIGGFAIASGRGVAAIGLAAIPLALFVLPRLSRAARLPVGYFSIEVPLVLVVLSTFVFRSRDAAALANDPIDSAAMYRLACVGGAALLAWVTLLRTPATSERIPLPIPIVLYGGYVAVVFLGAPLSLNLTLTAYRGVELFVGLLVVVTAVRYGGREAISRLERILYGYFVLLVLSVWVGVLLFPGQAVLRGATPIPFQIQGLYPAVSPNGVGEIGAVLLLWSLGLRLCGRRTGRLNLALIGLGALTLVAAQYRTGYLATALVLGLLMLVRGRKVLAALAIVASLAALMWSSSAITNAAEPYVLRGQSREQAATLSGRVSFWEHAIPVWRESPLLGKGLVTATRFEVLAPLGFTYVSTIHGTWVEALVGTGIVGVALLAAFVVLMWKAALADLLSRRGLVYPALLVVFFTVKSITGTSFELFGVTTLLVLVLAFALGESQRARESGGSSAAAM